MVNGFVAAVTALEVPLAVALAIPVAYRLTRGLWRQSPLGVRVAAVLCSIVAALLAVFALLTGSHPQDNAVFLSVIIGSGWGYLGLGAIARVALRGDSRR